MVESARKRGPFDPRYTPPIKLAPPNWELPSDLEGAERLDWSAFVERFFPTRRRHDFEALAAYEVYRNALSQAPQKHTPPTRRSALDRRSRRLSSAPTTRRQLRARPPAASSSERLPGAS